ncbi:hypothetical protein APS67_000447 [Streptomyces sp. AVP053U2]|uniref:DUF6214 family protein n=1 Tax=Streptomyces sp. NBRC 110035 TaxID=1547867 RepID=UPI0005A7E4AC|nr:DUF6214 family protein [Streptomyces sp. NBRC 110035]ODA75286.1 hypothetical protein APS67_000447 [Streptomyces sp. AVP053U2]
MWPAWEVREGEHATRWFHVRLIFADGAGVEALALVSGLCVCVEDVRARPALSLEDLALFADWIEGPLARACGADDGPGPGDGAAGVVAAGIASAAAVQPAADDDEAASEGGSAVRARPPGAGEPKTRSRAVRPREPVGRRLVAREYRAAQAEGVDPVLAVMCATGYSRRGALRVIGRARDAGLLTPRHTRRASE